MQTSSLPSPQAACLPQLLSDRENGQQLSVLNQQLAGLSPFDLLQWASAQFKPDLVVATSFGLSGMVILHAIAQMERQNRPPVFYLQTDLFFSETLALRDELAARFGLEFSAVSPEQSLAAQEAEFGPELWRRDPDLCCQLRKVQPLQRFLADKQAWVTGLRRDQSASRAAVDRLTWDEVHGLVKLNPLAYWTRAQVWQYIRAHRLPYNALHDRGYPSVGCWPCTQPAAAASEERLGRWPEFNKTECGIHTGFCLPRKAML
jgi:phosphoadenosine phosphosulfate reductase